MTGHLYATHAGVQHPTGCECGECSVWSDGRDCTGCGGCKDFAEDHTVHDCGHCGKYVDMWDDCGYFYVNIGKPRWDDIGYRPVCRACWDLHGYTTAER